MKIKREGEKRFFEKAQIFFASDTDCEDGNPYTVETKTELARWFGDYLRNTKEDNLLMAEDKWTVGINGTVSHTEYDNVTMTMFRQADFILWHNADEFMAWTNNPSALTAYAGEYEVKKSWAEL